MDETGWTIATESNARREAGRPVLPSRLRCNERDVLDGRRKK